MGKFGNLAIWVMVLYFIFYEYDVHILVKYLLDIRGGDILLYFLFGGWGRFGNLGYGIIFYILYFIIILYQGGGDILLYFYII